MSTLFRCGPLDIDVSAHPARLQQKVVEMLSLYNVVWDAPGTLLNVTVQHAETVATMVDGTYLTCARMHVDATDDGLYATCRSGASCSFSAATGQWSIAVPRPAPQQGVPEVPDDIEDLFGLVLATAWRQTGWVPLHAGAVTKGSCCALLAAPSGGGKTTLTAALIRRGWQTLGDDKLLLRLVDDGRPQLRALVHNFNLHPTTRRWFPEVGNLERLPVYSAWTEKRKVRIEDIWPGQVATVGQPTHLVQVVRRADLHGMRITRLTASDVLSALLSQTVLPTDHVMVRQLIGTVVRTARHLEGVCLEVGNEAYQDPRCLTDLEEALGT